MCEEKKLARKIVVIEPRLPLSVLDNDQDSYELRDFNRTKMSKHSETGVKLPPNGTTGAHHDTSESDVLAKDTKPSPQPSQDDLSTNEQNGDAQTKTEAAADLNAPGRPAGGPPDDQKPERTKGRIAVIMIALGVSFDISTGYRQLLT